MTKKRQMRLMIWAKRMADEGDEDCAWWVQKHIADEQRAARRPRGEAKKKVKMKASGAVIWVPARMIEESKEEGR